MDLDNLHAAPFACACRFILAANCKVVIKSAAINKMHGEVLRLIKGSSLKICGIIISLLYCNKD